MKRGASYKPSGWIAPGHNTREVPVLTILLVALPMAFALGLVLGGRIATSALERSLAGY